MSLLPPSSGRWVSSPDDGGSKDLWNVGKLLTHYTALQPRRQPCSFSLPWEPQILLVYIRITRRGTTRTKCSDACDTCSDACDTHSDACDTCSDACDTHRLTIILHCSGPSSRCGNSNMKRESQRGDSAGSNTTMHDLGIVIYQQPFTQ
jgi:hypothetical protein